MCAQPDQVRIEPAQLGQKHAKPLGLRRNLEIQQLFDGQRVAKVVRQRVEIVDAVGERHHLLVELGLASLLDARVQVANLWIDPDHDLAVDLQHQAQNAMRSRVLRAHVDDHVLVAGAFGRLESGHACWIAHQRYPSTG